MVIAQKMKAPLASGYGFRRMARVAIREVAPVKVHLLGATPTIRLWDGERWKAVGLS